MFRNILVPVDGSTNSIQALDKAVELAKLCGAALSVLTVYRHHSLLESSFAMVRRDEPGNMDDILRDHATHVAETAKARAIDAGMAGTRAFVKNGPVSRGIAAFAKEHGCDLIVMGGRGLGSTEAYLLGSVSHKVTGTAPCPVMVV